MSSDVWWFRLGMCIVFVQDVLCMYARANAKLRARFLTTISSTICAYNMLHDMSHNQLHMLNSLTWTSITQGTTSTNCRYE